MEQTEYLENYEKELTQHLLKMLTSMELLDRQLLESPDISEQWDVVAPSYLADSVKEIVQFPTVALGWSMYLGMAVAHFWDEDWDKYGTMPNIYEFVRDKRGFDYLDEVVRGEILGLAGKEFDEMEKVVQGCANQVLAKIRHDQVEPQSPLAFHVFVRSIKVLYQIGASVELRRLGYKFEKVE